MLYMIVIDEPNRCAAWNGCVEGALFALRRGRHGGDGRDRREEEEEAEEREPEERGLDAHGAE